MSFRQSEYSHDGIYEQPAVPLMSLKGSSPREQELRWSRSNRIHWQAPTIMIISLVIGVLGAVAHHVLYAGMNGIAVKSQLEQQVIVSSGTVFAFIVKVGLAFSTSIAFFQCIWPSLRAKSANIKQMDSIFGVLTDPTKFFHVRFWQDRPKLILIATITWLIPLSAMFTPATMSVVLAQHNGSETLIFPQRDPTDRQSALDPTSDGKYKYTGVSLFHYQMALVSVVQGSPVRMPFTPALRNYTTTLAFHGPAVKCSEANDTSSNFLRTAVDQWQKEQNAYLFWLGFASNAAFGSDMNSTTVANFMKQRNSNRVNPTINETARMYQYMRFPSKNDIGLPQTDRESTLIECSLYNASYHAQLEFQRSGVQYLRANRTLLREVIWTNLLPSTMSPKEATETIYHLNLFEQYITNILGSFHRTSLGAGPGYGAGDLMSSPVLGSAVAPGRNGYGSMNKTQFKSAMEDVFQNMTLSYRWGLLGIEDLGNLLVPISPQKFY